jgi:mitochondrial fission protein ELM1
MWWFDLCLVPAHDLSSRRERRGIVRTRGALNRIPENIPVKQERGVILVGGPSKHYGWAAEELQKAIITVTAATPELEWVIGDSRRTPEGFLSALSSGGIRATCVPWQQTAPDWLPAQLLAAKEAWVTEDSISMLHEAVTAGARTGVLPTPVRRDRARVLNAVRGLVADGYATWYADWAQNGRHLMLPKHLHETGRCADVILERFFSEK